MFSIQRTTAFIIWLTRLKDRRAVARIAIRIDRFAGGNPGQTRDPGQGLGEMKIDYGPDYRVYYMRRGEVVYLLLRDGDKSTQAKDIVEARKLAKELRDDPED